MMGIISMSDIKDKDNNRPLTKDEQIKENWGWLKKNQNKIYPMITKDSPHPISNVLSDGAWEGRRCFIVGGGSSLKGFNFSALKDELTIGLNMAFTKFDPTILFSIDSRFHSWISNGSISADATKKFNQYKGLKVWNNLHNFNFPEDVYQIDSSGVRGLTTSLLYGIAHGNNSGYAAINLACCLGANPIYLLGYDMKGDGKNQSWWHKGYPSVQPESIYNKMNPHFEGISTTLLLRSFKVINLNKNSAIKCFEFGKFKDIKPIKKPLFVSYFTSNTGYEEEVKNLQASLELFNLDYRIMRLSSLGSWNENTCLKPMVLKKAMEDNPGRDIIWLDADARVMKYPSLFDYLSKLDVDLAVHHRFGREQLTGTLFIKNNAAMAGMLNRWVAECKKWTAADSQICNGIKLDSDQTIFQRVLSKEKDIKVIDLPSQYCQIFDAIEGNYLPVIQHYQASRRFKEQVNNNG